MSTAANHTNSDDEEIDPFTMILPLNGNLDSSSAAAVDLASSDSIHRHHLPSIDSTITIRQLPSLGISFQLWPAASSLVSLLPSLYDLIHSSPHPNRRLRILELGSGTGLVGIAAAAILGAEVTVTDLALALPNLRFNVASNADTISSNGGSVEVAEIAWGVQEQMEAVGREFDVVLGSDLVYHDHLFEPLQKTLEYLVGGEEGDLVFVMAHLKRWKKESVFFNKCRKMFSVEVAHREKPDDGKRVGVLVYRFSSKRRRVG